MFLRSTSLLVTAAALSILAGCSTHRPQVKVIGISQPHRVVANDDQSVILFLEVVNPTPRDLRLSRIEYQLDAESWFASRGAVKLSRAVGADSVAVVEIPIPVDASAHAERARKVPYRFEGRLYTLEERVERSWRVKVNGTIGATPLGASGPRIYGTVAAAE